MTKDGAVFAKGKVKGEVSYPPFENLDEEILREVQKFQVYPLGKIDDYCRHIPYNSEKKSFLEKTGRESFEGKITYYRVESLAYRRLQSSSIFSKFPETTRITP